MRTAIMVSTKPTRMAQPQASLKKVSSTPQRSLSAIQTPVLTMRPAAVRKAGTASFMTDPMTGP